MVTADGQESGELTKLQQSYELLGELSRDERVTVYLARDRRSGKEVAVKVLRAADAPSREALAHYASDARMLTALEHPNIIAVYAVKWLSEDVVAVVTERVRGPTLRQVLDVAGTLPVARATEVIRGLGRALAWAHSGQIMHRDMRPENVLFEDRTGRVVLSDFGLARRVENVPGPGEPDPYRAPELVDGRYPDRRSDVYSLGIIGWELLTGRRPWPDDMEPVLPGERAPEPPPLAEVRPGLPPALVAAIEGAVQLDRDRRLPDVVTLMERLTGVAPPEPEADQAEEQVEEQAPSFAPTEWVALPVPRMPQRPRPAVSDREISRAVSPEQVSSEQPASANAPSAPSAGTVPSGEVPIVADVRVEGATEPTSPGRADTQQPRARKTGGMPASKTSPRADQPLTAEPGEGLARPESHALRGDAREEPSSVNLPSGLAGAAGAAAAAAAAAATGAAPGAAADAAASTAQPSTPVPSAPVPPSGPSRPRPRADAPTGPKPVRGEDRASGPPQPELRAGLAPMADRPVADSPRERSGPHAPSLEGSSAARRSTAHPSAESPSIERSSTERMRSNRPPAERARPDSGAAADRPTRNVDVPMAGAPFADALLADAASTRVQGPAARTDAPPPLADALPPRADRPPKVPYERERDVTGQLATPLSDVELPPPEPVPMADVRPEPLSGPISGPLRSPVHPVERFEPAMRGGLGTPRPAKAREPKAREKKRSSLGTPTPALQPVWDTPVEFPLPAMPDPRPTPAMGSPASPSGFRQRFTRRGITIGAVVVAALIGALTLVRMERAPDTTADLMRPETPAGYGGDVVLERGAADSSGVRGPASATPGGNAARRGGNTANPAPSSSAAPAPARPRPDDGSTSTTGRTTAPTPSPRASSTPRAPQPVAATRQPSAAGASSSPTRAGAPPARPTPPRSTTIRDTQPTEGAATTTRTAERPAAATAIDAPSAADARPTGPCGSAALADQRACLAAHIERTDADLNETYGNVIVALRRRASSAPGDPDPPEVQRLRSVQRSWLARRDAECRRRGRGREGRLWATPRAQCLQEFTNERNRELSAMLGRLRRD